MTSHRTIPTGPNREELVDPATGSLKTKVVAPLREGRVDTAESFTDMEVLADQSGAGGVLTFTFASPMDLVWVRCSGGVGRASAAGAADPAASRGAYCEDGEPEPISVRTTTVRVFAGSGTIVSVWGYRYA